ncbi:hypothetical protein [Actinoplanes couchii]|uniref:hypothetical protein n=1 Tax=Actinoplanes couchii TaxID=403638 RepID=UPI001940FD0C|nr:hypothetical protein [Actinoplanes couchii]MDR6319890.1 hypothetical protein [Actinoplanes couchii]
MRRRMLLGSAAVGAAGLVGWRPGSSLAAPAEATSRGGSNYGWYQIDGCNREPYGVVNSFHKAPDLIRSQLAAMRAAGQARLRVHIIHRHRADTGTCMDSTGGNISAANRQNLADLLRAIKDAGFVEIQVAFMPIGENAAYNWTSWNEDIYQENWRLIANLRPIIAGSGLHYRIDLCNEAVPTDLQPLLLRYTQQLWKDYTNAFDKKDTVGFSAIGYAGRIQNIPKVYGNNAPYLFDFHFYRRNGVDEGALFTTAHTMMNQYGYTKQGWTIGEAFNNDSIAASSLRQAINSTDRTVYYLLQWPRQAPSDDPTCPDATVLPPPVNFGNYIAQGF